MADISKIILPNGNNYNLKDESAARVWFGTCTEAASTAAKTVNITGFTSDKLVNGTKIVVQFSNGHTYDGAATLNVTSTGAKTIYYTDYISSQKGAWDDNALITFTYYNNIWYMDRRDYLTLEDLPIYDGTVV